MSQKKADLVSRMRKRADDIIFLDMNGVPLNNAVDIRRWADEIDADSKAREEEKCPKCKIVKLTKMPSAGIGAPAPLVLKCALCGYYKVNGKETADPNDHTAERDKAILQAIQNAEFCMLNGDTVSASTFLNYAVGELS